VIGNNPFVFHNQDSGAHARILKHTYARFLAVTGNSSSHNDRRQVKENGRVQDNPKQTKERKRTPNYIGRNRRTPPLKKE
jgi:hypothetical protein